VDIVILFDVEVRICTVQDISANIPKGGAKKDKKNEK